MNDRILFRSDSLTEAAAELNKLIEALEDVSSGLSRVNTSEDWWSSVSVRTSHGKQSALEAVRTLRSDTDKAREYVSDINSGIQKTKSLFTETDKEITRMVTAASTGTGHEYGDNSGQTSVGNGSGSGTDTKPSGINWFWNKIKDLFLDESRVPSAIAIADWLGYELMDDHPGITAWIGKAEAKAESDWGYAGVEAYIGKAEAEFKGDFSFFKKSYKKEKNEDGEWEETSKTTIVNAEIGGGAKVSGVEVDGKAGLGSDMLGVEGEAKGVIGSARAEGKAHFSVGEDGVNFNVQGEAMVAAVEGEVSGTVNILGIEITAKAGGYAGALGVEGKAGIEDGKFTVKGGAAAGVGGSLTLEIGFNEEGWDNFVDFITFWD